MSADSPLLVHNAFALGTIKEQGFFLPTNSPCSEELEKDWINLLLIAGK